MDFAVSNKKKLNGKFVWFKTNLKFNIIFDKKKKFDSNAEP